MTPEQILSKIYARIQAIDVTGDFQAEAEAYWDCLEDVRLMIPYETARKHFAGRTTESKLLGYMDENGNYVPGRLPARTAPLGEGYPHDVPLEFEA